jgi:phosphoserine phosphatase
VPGYDVAAWSRAAEETGGDTFDVVGLEPDGRGYRLVESGEALALGLLLADATGHGVGPAIAVTQLQAMVRIAWRTNRSLMDVVGLVSERLAASLPDGRFITAWLAKLDHRADEIEMFAAGQGPIFRVSAAGDVEALAADSYPLGIEAGVLAAEPRRVRLEPGDMVVVVSDGLLEQADARGEQFGNARMERLIAERRGGDAASLVSAIHAAVDAFCGGGQADDQTVLVVKRQVACKI